MKKLSILVFGLLIAAASPSILAQPGGKNQTQTSPTPQKISSDALIEGTPVMFRIVGVKDNVPSANEYTGPDKGNKFVSVQIVVDNSKGNEEWTVEPHNFKLKDAEGGVYETESLSEITQPTLKSGGIDAGDLVKGWITFQVGETVSIRSMKLRYEDSVLSGTVAKSAWIPLSSVAK